MGIKDLWNILTPHSERKPLHILEGKKVGIDLSGWVCESQCVVDYFVQPKMYLRNLFFRTAYLLLMNITPVFVSDGEAPVLKHQMIQKRNEQNQFIGARPRQQASQSSQAKEKSKPPPKGRTRFNYVLKQCRDLLIAMGVPCIQAIGEAEALCAWLNKDGLIDGVISQDSDCFAYGAVMVYRNFSVSKQGKQTGQNGSIDVYDMQKIWQKDVDLKQNKAVVLGLLCGCDYAPDGIDGVGKEAVLKLFSMYKDDVILDKMREWRSRDDKFSELEVKVDDKNYCNGCGHYGSYQKHSKSGCSTCRMGIGCDTSIWKEKRLMIKAELQIRKKALQNHDFPSEDIINEFLQSPQMPEKLCMTWQQPNIVKFVNTLSKQLQWPEIYCFQKILPLLTRWQLLALCIDSSTKFSKGSVFPVKIRKKRVLKGIESYEILWEDRDKCFDALFPEEEVKAFEIEHPTEGIESLWCTVEPKGLVEQAYPCIVDEFLESTLKKKKSTKATKSRKKEIAENTPRQLKKSKSKHNTSLNDMSGLLEAIEEVQKKPNRRARKKTVPHEKGIQPITKFLKEAILAQSTPTRPIQRFPLQEKLNQPPISMEIPSDFSDCSDIDESHTKIINEIVKQKSDLSRLNGRSLHYERSFTRNKFSMDDTMLQKVKRKSYQVNLSLYKDSWDDFLVGAQFENDISLKDPMTTVMKSNNEVEDLEQSYFFDRLDDYKEDFFERSLNQMTTFTQNPVINNDDSIIIL